MSDNKKEKYTGHWLHIESGEYHHVIPEQDIRPHCHLPDTTIAGVDCPCNPKVNGDVIIHNSFQDKDFLDEHLYNLFNK